MRAHLAEALEISVITPLFKVVKNSYPESSSSRPGIMIMLNYISCFQFNAL